MGNVKNFPKMIWLMVATILLIAHSALARLGNLAYRDRKCVPIFEFTIKGEHNVDRKTTGTHQARC